ncbi:nucleoside kinase [Myxococcota bacterium]|nr:nucleoside kinase [Myxococcota bacterium]
MTTRTDKERMLQVQLGDRTVEVLYGTSVHQLFTLFLSPEEFKESIAAIVENRTYGLTFPLRADCRVSPITVADRHGASVYRRSASLMLLEAVKRVCPPGTKLIVGQSIQDGYLYNLTGLPEGMTKEIIARINEEMRRICDENHPFVVESLSVPDVKKMLLEVDQPEKVNLLRIHWEPQVRIVRCASSFDLFHEPYAPSTSYIDTFEITPYWPGMVLRLPSRGAKVIRGKIAQLPRLFQSYTETRAWNRMLGVENLGQLNEVTLGGDIKTIVQVAEGLHEKKIALIADAIATRRPDVQLVMIAGPSSSGKTTFSKRLGVQLQVLGLRPVTIEMDNFFVERDQTPRDERGDFDFESIEAIDIDLFNDVLVKLLDGDEALVPIFDFKTGCKRPREEWVPHRMAQDQILIIEGIHGLNDRLTQGVLSHRKYKIYISALTQLCIDDHNRIFTSDSRLIRRIVRDRNFRGYGAAETIKRWPSVRKGELKNIFPFQEHADVMFNSALVYEPGVLKSVCERALLEVPPDDEAFVEAYRLLRFLRLVMPISKQLVPPNSILREFIGYSSF